MQGTTQVISQELTMFLTSTISPLLSHSPAAGGKPGSFVTDLFLKLATNGNMRYSMNYTTYIQKRCYGLI